MKIGMKILVTGATGFIGAAIAKALWQAGHTVVACVHRQPVNDAVPYKVLECDFMRDTDAAVWEPRLDGIDLVINAVGIIQQTSEASFQRLHADTPIALFQACKTKHLRVIQISGLGADKPNSPFEFLSSKTQADNYLFHQCAQAVILYPSIVIGRGGASTALFNTLAALPLIPLVGKGEQRLNPIHIDDLCAVVVDLLSHWPSDNQKYYLAGPEMLSFKGLLQLLRQSLGLSPARFIEVPQALMRSAARVSQALRLSTLNADSLQMFDAVTPEPANYPHLNIQPLSQRLACERPDRDEVLSWQTRLIWPLLWFSLAMLWVFTGLTSAFFDQATGYALLAQANIHGTPASLLIYGGAATDLLLGLGMLCGWRLVYLAQIALMLVYMVLITCLVPQEWLHPLGAITKNIPLVFATYLLYRRAS